jgi:hypothetical protein
MSPGLLQRLETATENTNLLSQWETGYIESLLQQLNKRGSLSPRQVEVLERIETQKLSKAAYEANQQWVANYGEEKRRIAMICAKYYLKTGYFTSLATDVVKNPDFTPTERAWKKMCLNKYARKVVAEYDAPPKYAVGSVVELRSTVDSTMKHSANGMPCVVISSGGDIMSAAKGSKPYKVLPYGSVKMIDCEERHVKKCKKPKKKSTNFVDNDASF